MKKVRKILCFLITLFAILIAFENKASASSDLYLNSLHFDVEINKDASINVTEYWDIDIEYTNTLYKSFDTDYSKYTGITDVKVTDITGGKNSAFIKQNNWEYHVAVNRYYGTQNQHGDFEIGWGVGLDNNSDTRKYKIEYKVQNAITKYNDYAELYWQLLGDDFEIDSKKVTGTVTLPEKVRNKEDIKVWGHIDTLNGTIYATDLDKIEFDVNKYEGNHMLEIRTLFPTDIITTASRTYNKNILQSVIDEETKWAEEANAKRTAKTAIITFGITLIGLVLDFMFVTTILRVNKNPIRKQTKFVPDQPIEYYRDIPRKSATPGQAVQLIQKNMSETFNSNDLGKVFSAVLLNLKLKGYLEFEIDETKKDKEKISIKLQKKDTLEPLQAEEMEIYHFLERASSKKDDRTLTIKELQKFIKSNSTRVAALGEKIGKNVHKELVNENLLDKKQLEEYTSSITVIILQIVFLFMYLIFCLAILNTSGIIFNVICKFILALTFILGIISIFKKISIIRKVNVFTKERSK